MAGWGVLRLAGQKLTRTGFFLKVYITSLKVPKWSLVVKDYHVNVAYHVHFVFEKYVNLQYIAAMYITVFDEFHGILTENANGKYIE